MELKIFGRVLWSDGVEKKNEEISKKLSSLEGKLSKSQGSQYGVRTQLDKLLFQSSDGIAIPLLPFSDIQLYILARTSDTLATILNAKRSEVFRNGAEFVGRFDAKCSYCSKEFENDVAVCDSCGGATFEPRESQTQQAEEFFKKVNSNNQSLIELCQMLEDDLNIRDDAFLIFSKDYRFDLNGAIESSSILELVRGDPTCLRFIADKSGRIGYIDKGDKSEMVKTCPVHRSIRYREQDKRCTAKECNRVLYQAFFAATNPGSSTALFYYIDGEVHHESRYFPTLLYGFSPIGSVWQKVMTLLNQDKYLMDYYGSKKPIRGIAAIKTKNLDTFEAFLDKLEMKRKQDPFYTPFIMSEMDGGGQFLQYVDFMKSLTEQQFTEQRQEYRQIIGSVFGVSPIFQGDVSASGGLNNEGLQITVTSRQVESDQRNYNEGFFEEITRQFGITDFDFILNEPEEHDEMADLQVEQQKIANAQGMRALGFSVSRDESGEFTFEKDQTQPVQPFNFNGQQQGIQQQNSGQPVQLGKTLVKSSSAPVKSIISNSDDYNEAYKIILDEIKGDLKFKRKVDQASFEKRVSKAFDALRRQLHAKSKKELKKIYQQAVEQVEKELNKNILFEGRDENALEVVSHNPKLIDSINGYSEKQKGKVEEIIRSAYSKPEGFSLQDLVGEMQKALDDSESHLNLIARNETQNITNFARAVSYGKEDDGTFLYKWIGPVDDRTTQICKKIGDETSLGVPMEELQSIIAKNADQNTYDSSRPFSPHIQCRRIFVRIQPIRKDYVYLDEGESAPEGASVDVGPRGGRRYNSTGYEGQGGSPSSSSSQEKPNPEQKPNSVQEKIDSVKEYFTKPETKQWAEKVLEYHEKTPRDKPIFVFGTHTAENNTTEKMREELIRLGFKVLEIPKEFSRLQGEPSKPENRKNLDSFLGKLFEGRAVVDIHGGTGMGPSTELFDSQSLGKFGIKDAPKNYVGLEVGSNAGSQMQVEQIIFGIRRIMQKTGESKKGYYDARLGVFGDGALAVGWKDKELQEKRFEQLMKVFDGEDSSVLDVGAGLGGFYFSMMKFFPGMNYVGIEKEKSFVEKVQSNGVGPFNLYEQDFFERNWGAENGYDYVVASGTFNTEGSDLLKAIPKMIRVAKKGVAFNFLTKSTAEGIVPYGAQEVFDLIVKEGFTAQMLPGTIPEEIVVYVKKQGGGD